MLTQYQISHLLEDGFVHLEQVKITETYQKEIVNNIKKKKLGYYSDSLEFHDKYFNDYNLIDLSHDLQEFAKKYYGYNCNLKDIYKITRVVGGDDSSEFFRFHFDSHLFTLVTPIYLPDKKNSSENGELILFPKIRKNPKFEIINILQKILFKKYSGYSGFNKLSNRYSSYEFDFQDTRPLLFMGRECLHGNKPFRSDEKRITMLTHFFDPSGNLAIGNLLRILRNR